MQKGEEGIPAWLVCEDIFNKIKTELITQAMDTLQEAINSKAIEIKGSLVSVPDKPSDTEMQIFIIARLMGQRGEIDKRYQSYLADDPEKDPNKVIQKERLRKFLLAVDQISMLMHYSEIFETWMHDIAMQISQKEPYEVIKATLKQDTSRIELLGYVIHNAKMEKEKVLTKTERKILADSLQ